MPHQITVPRRITSHDRSLARIYRQLPVSPNCSAGGYPRFWGCFDLPDASPWEMRTALEVARPTGRLTEDEMMAGTSLKPGSQMSIRVHLWAVWVAVAAIAAAIFLTYALLPASEFYHVSHEGLAGGASRALVYSNFPVSLVGLAAIGVSLILLRRRAMFTVIGAVGAVLCLATVVPGSRQTIEPRCQVDQRRAAPGCPHCRAADLVRDPGSRRGAIHPLDLEGPSWPRNHDRAGRAWAALVPGGCRSLHRRHSGAWFDLLLEADP